MVKAACALRIGEKTHSFVERTHIEHRAGQDHARHAGRGMLDAYVVDRLREPRAIRREGVSRQRARIVEADEAGLAVGPDIDERTLVAQIRIAVFVVRDEARIAGVRYGRERRASIRRVVDQFAATVPEEATSSG